MSEARTVRTLTPEIKILSSTTGEVEYIASDASLDCYKEILVPGGVDFSRFEKNAPFVDSHDYSTLERLLGSVTAFSVKGGQVIERVKWAVNESPLAALGFKLTESGHLKAVSVGFMPGRMVWRDTPEFTDAVKQLKLSADIATQVRCIHLTWQQIELSACIIGANPNALAKAFGEGALKEADLAGIGFHGDAEYEFLQLSAATYDKLDAIQRAQVRLEMQRIYRARSLSPQQRSSQPHQAPGGDEAARRQAAEQREASMQEVLNAMKAMPRITA